MLEKGERVSVELVENGDLVRRRGYVVDQLQVLGESLAYVHVSGYPLPYLLPTKHIRKLHVVEMV